VVTADVHNPLWKVSIREVPPTVVRWRSDVTVPDPDRAFKVTVGFMFNHLAENGMPDSRAEGPHMKAVQDDLKAVLASHGALWVLSVTGQGNREWVAYAPSHEWVEAWAPGFAGRWFREHTHQIGVARDPEWKTYRAFTGMLPVGAQN
jgi:Family of unknown function (DUF695)